MNVLLLKIKNAEIKILPVHQKQKAVHFPRLKFCAGFGSDLEILQKTFFIQKIPFSANISDSSGSGTEKIRK